MLFSLELKIISILCIQSIFNLHWVHVDLRDFLDVASVRNVHATLPKREQYKAEERCSFYN